MKQEPNDKPLSTEGIGKNAEKDANNAQSAMADYFDDMLGATLDDPLKELNERELAAKAVPDSTSAQPEVKRARAEQKKKAVKAEFAEREVKQVITQVVIPAAFPKLAPAQEEKGESVKEKLRKPLKIPQNEGLVTPPKPRLAEDAVAKDEAKVAKKSPPEQKIPDAPVPDPVTPPAEESAEENIVADVEIEEIKEPESWLENGRPAWAQDRFECLLFSVAGLKLAVPLISLGAIYKIENEFTPLVGRAEWFMGLYRTQDRNVQVVDTARWVMPDRYHDQVKEGYQFIIRLGGNNWGIACDQVFEAISLEPDQVRWRSERSKRPWLSGTVIDHMCALLDADTLSYLLHKDVRIH